MKVHPVRRPCASILASLAVSLFAPSLQAQPTQAQPAAAPVPQRLRSRLFLYDLQSGASRLVFSANGIWEAPNWSPDGKYLIVNSGGAIYKLTLARDGTAEPVKLAIPADYQCNNDKALSPDGSQIAFSATVPPQKGSQIFLAAADGTHAKRMTSDSPSYFHGWSPDGRTLAFVAQRNGSGQFDIYAMPAAGRPEKQLTSNLHHDDGPDYSPDGRWIYINSDRSGKEAIWRFPAGGAGPRDELAQRILSDDLEDWFPHISPDGKKMVYIGYPAGTPTHNPRTVKIELRLIGVDQGPVAASPKTLIRAIGGQGTMNVNSWAPDSMRFAYITYEVLP